LTFEKSSFRHVKSGLLLRPRSQAGNIFAALRISGCGSECCGTGICQREYRQGTTNQLRPAGGYKPYTLQPNLDRDRTRRFGRQCQVHL